MRPVPFLLPRTLTLLSALLMALVLGAASPSAAAPHVQITITSSTGEPDRGDTGLAWDADLLTDTFTTPSGNTGPASLDFGFDSAPINRIRIYKNNEYGPHDLTIQYTTDTDGNLADRDWMTVSNLANGFHHKEFLNATSVNSDGTVTGDVHDSPGGDGWASLTFSTVTATGISILFTTGGSTITSGSSSSRYTTRRASSTGSSVTAEAPVGRRPSRGMAIPSAAEVSGRSQIKETSNKG